MSDWKEYKPTFIGFGTIDMSLKFKKLKGHFQIITKDGEIQAVVLHTENKANIYRMPKEPDDV